MACSRFEYVRHFEQHTPLLPGAWAVVRLDGRGFTLFTTAHGYAKPNDARGLSLMNDAAACVARAFPDVVLAFCQSDEASFVLRRDSKLYGRRAEKILSTVVSLFSAEFVRRWPARFPTTELLRAPSFDGRVVLYPTDRTLRDYLAWRQADVHVNNLFNTAFWALVSSGVSNRDAERELSGTSSAQKNELLFSRFGINYNNEPAMFRKGSIILRVVALNGSAARDAREAGTGKEGPVLGHTSSRPEDDSKGAVSVTPSYSASCAENRKLPPSSTVPVGDEATSSSGHGKGDYIEILHEDIIRDAFWNAREHLLRPSDAEMRKP